MDHCSPGDIVMVEPSAGFNSGLADVGKRQMPIGHALPTASSPTEYAKVDAFTT